MKEQHPTRPKSRKTISIIVPVYKTERFLNACIASILAQTFTDFELILVWTMALRTAALLCVMPQRQRTAASGSSTRRIVA